MPGSKTRLETLILVLLALTGWTLITGKTASKEPEKIFAQQLVEQALAKHPELSAVEMATTPLHQQCVTIAATEAKDLGEKCDDDEFTAMRTQKPLVEKEEEGFDITVPLHDATGKLIGTVGMDFKAGPGQQQSKLVELAQEVVRELEARISSQAKLFEPAK